MRSNAKRNLVSQPQTSFTGKGASRALTALSSFSRPRDLCQEYR